MSQLLTINQLQKTYDGKNFVLQNINLEINPGEFIAIIGSSGAGKSTLIRCINRLVEPTAGEIIFDDVEVNTLKNAQLAKLRTKIGMIFQHFNLIESSNVLNNVLHGTLGKLSSLKSICGLYSTKQKQEVLDLLKAVGLQDYQYQKAARLSGGQMQRVGICRALMQNPKLLLADEPIASLDPISAKSVMDQIKKITKERALTCIVNLHQVEFAKQYATRIIGLKAGQIVFDGPPTALDDATIANIYNEPVAINTAKPKLKLSSTTISLSAENPVKRVGKLLAVFAIIGLAFHYLEVNALNILLALPNLFQFLAQNFWPPNFNNFTIHLAVVFDTLLFAILGTFISSVMALFFGLLMSQALNPILPLRLLVRFVVAFFRNVPLLIWATLVVYIFGIGPLVGVIALIFATFGFLARSYAESINEIATTKLEALRAAGASYCQLLVHGLLPEFMPALINWSLFALEINIRASGILGMVGAGGLGLLIQTRLDLRNFRSAFALIITLTLMVLFTEMLTNYLRCLLKKSQVATRSPKQTLIARVSISLITITLVAYSAIHLNLNFGSFFARLENATTVLTHFFALDLTGLPEIIYQLLISIALGICGLVIGGLLALMLAFIAANNLTFNRSISLLIKSFISILRAIPSLVLILMIVASLGFGYSAAIIGLAFSTMGYLTKAFIATIEEQDFAIIETLTTTGATKLQIIAHGIWPNVKNAFLSWIFIRLESNIADSISLGIVGAGGVGMLLARAIRQHQFAQISTIIVVVFITMLLLEAFSNYLKQKLAQ